MTGIMGLMQTSLPRLAQPTIAAVALTYFAIVAVIGAWAVRRTRTANDFFAAGDGIGLIALTLAAMSATVSGFAFIGGPGLVYMSGMGAVFLTLSSSVTAAMTSWVLAKRLRLLAEVRGLITIPEAIGARYRSPAAQGWSAVAILVAVVGYMATNILALGVVIDAVFGTGLTLGVWLGMLTILAYSATGGILAGVYTDVFQGTLMAIASTLVFIYALHTGGGMGAISRTIMASDPEFLAPFGKLGAGAALSLFFVFGVGTMGQPHVLHKYYMLRDPRRLKWYPLLMTATLVMTMLLFFGVGVTVKALVASGRMPALARPEEATPLFLLGYTPMFLAGLVFAGVAAAIMSTVNSFMNIGAAALTRDLPAAFGRRVDNELRWGRIGTVVISILAAWLALLPGAFVAFLGIFGWGLFASTLVPALAIGLNWEGATREGAITSILTGLVVTLGFETMAAVNVYRFPTGVTVSAFSLVLSILVFFGVSWMTRARAAAALDEDIVLVMRA